jgi:hypothetical protein
VLQYRREAAARAASVLLQRVARGFLGNPEREFVDYKTSIFIDEDPLRGLSFY